MSNLKWVQVYQERDVELFPFYLWAKPWFDKVPKIIGSNLNNIALLFSRSGVAYFVDEEEYIHFGRAVFKKFENQKSYSQIVAETKNYLNILQKETTNLEHKDFSSLNNKELFASILELVGYIENLNS